MPDDCAGVYVISIHALREEGDGLPSHTFSLSLIFLSTPSARRATSDQAVLQHWFSSFLSTPSARRATWYRGIPQNRKTISIHALREEGDFGKLAANPWICISIHALREEGDKQAVLIGRMD